MIKKLLFVFLPLVVCFVNTTDATGWGVWAHYRINKGAIMALPDDPGMFFYNHADYITEESVVPDVRKHDLKDKAESIRHYIDLEGYKTGKATDFPKTYNEAVTKFSKDTLQKYGILPWTITDFMEQLTNAFKAKNKAEILFLAADLGHYIGDAHMPLHTSLNHDGQFTGQNGIHGFWEGQLPEAFGENYNLFTGEAQYVDNVTAKTWEIIFHSFSLADSMLKIEKDLRKDKPDEKMYVMDAKGSIIKNKYGQPEHSPEYARKYHEFLNGMVEKQLKAALKTTADLWYTAWVNAGRPDLSSLDPDNITKANKKAYKKAKKLWQSGKVDGFKTINEY